MRLLSEAEQSALTQLVKDRIDSMKSVGWESWATAIREAGNKPSGETDCIQISGVWYEVGEHIRWLNAEGGDIEVSVFAYLASDDAPIEITRRIVVRRPQWRGISK